MRTKLDFASNYGDEDRIQTLEVSSLEDLKQLQDKYGHSLVIYFGVNPYTNDGTQLNITVYDDYLE